MNFIEAVRELKGGRCDAIKSIVSGRVFEKSEQRVYPTSGFAQISFVEIDGDFTLVNPTPRTEREEVKRWGYFRKFDNICAGTYGEPQPNLGSSDKFYEVEFTGYVDAPVKEKVKRRVEIPSTAVNLSKTCCPAFKDDIRFFAEWEEWS